MDVATTIDGLFSTSEAARELGISDSLVRRYIREGRLRYVTGGARAKFIPKESLDEFKQVPRKPGPPSRD